MALSIHSMSSGLMLSKVEASTKSAWVARLAEARRGGRNWQLYPALILFLNN